MRTIRQQLVTPQQPRGRYQYQYAGDVDQQQQAPPPEEIRDFGVQCHTHRLTFKNSSVSVVFLSLSVLL